MKYFAYILIALTISSTQQEMFAQSGWFVTYSGNNSWVEGLSFPNENTGYICADSLKKTTNGGATWFKISNLSLDFTDVHFFNANTGVYSSWAGGTIWKTTNGGTTLQQLGTVQSGIFSISFPSIDTGYILTKYFGIWKTTNGGVTCFETTVDWYDMEGGRVFFLNNQTGYATGHHSDIIKTTNGGAFWDTLRISDVNHSYGVYFFNVNTGFILGYNQNTYPLGKICKTTDGGTSWMVNNLDSVDNPQSYLYFINQNTGFIFGAFQKMYKTTDGGNNWNKMRDFYFSGLYRMQFVNEMTGYGVSFGGWVIKTTNGGTPIGIHPISTEIPNQFSLSQNYPNPFNPNTKIQFALPKSSFAKLVVYDALGREIGTLVNERLNAGTYEADWNADKFSSGVYYYKLTAENYTETKKMVLMK